jgi:hypothetical protein
MWLSLGGLISIQFLSFPYRYKYGAIYISSMKTMTYVFPFKGGVKKPDTSKGFALLHRMSGAPLVPVNGLPQLLAPGAFPIIGVPVRSAIAFEHLGAARLPSAQTRHTKLT